MMHICVINPTIFGSDNGLSPGQRQAIFWTNTGILSIWPLGTNFSEMLIKIYTFSFMKMHMKMSSAKRRPFCPVRDELKLWFTWEDKHPVSGSSKVSHGAKCPRVGGMPPLRVMALVTWTQNYQSKLWVPYLPISPLTFGYFNGDNICCTMIFVKIYNNMIFYWLFSISVWWYL